MIKCAAILSDITIRVDLRIWRRIMSAKHFGVSIFNDSGHSKEDITWKLGRVTKVEPRKVTIEYVSKISIQGKSTLSQVSRNPRDISILFSVDQLFINNSRFN